MIIIVVTTIVCAVLLILVVLAQNSKGGGLSDQFGGSSSSQLIGVKRTGDLLEKITWGLALAIFVLAVSSKAFMGSSAPIEAEENSTVDVSAPVAPPSAQPQNAPATPAGGEELPAELTGGSDESEDE